MLTIAQAYASFQEIAADLPQDDKIMISEAWNDYTDSLCKDGELTALQYHYCPAYGDKMPNDDFESDINLILDGMGCKFSVRKEARRDDGLFGDMAHHWYYTFDYGVRFMSGYFSQGRAHMSAPSACDVLGCLFGDYINPDVDFSEWCSDFGYDDDSIKALAIYNACREKSPDLRDMFKSSDFYDLQQLCAEL